MMHSSCSARNILTIHHWVFLTVSIGLMPCLAQAGTGYVQANLVSDGAVPAATIDPNLKNPWGISLSSSSPFWVSDNAAGVATLYNGAGTPVSLVVTVPGGPTGQVNNGTSDFVLNDNAKANFIFATLGGTIAGWNGGEGTTAQTVATVAGAVFTGLAIGNNGTGNFLYAANNAGGINVFNNTFGAATVSGNFTDPNLPAGFTPYNIQNINGTLYVTYIGAAGGVVDAYDLNGNFLRRIATNGPLNEPWGLALAPSTFGTLGGDLLVGNLADGRISAFNPNVTNDFLGQLTLANGSLFSEPGLWGLTFGNGGSGGDPNTLYFAAGINGQADGLFGAIGIPEPSSGVLGLIAAGVLAAGWRWKKRRSSLRRLTTG